jgi:hypothetical protein
MVNQGSGLLLRVGPEERDGRAAGRSRADKADSRSRRPRPRPRPRHRRKPCPGMCHRPGIPSFPDSCLSLWSVSHLFLSPSFRSHEKADIDVALSVPSAYGGIMRFGLKLSMPLILLPFLLQRRVMTAGVRANPEPMRYLRTVGNWQAGTAPCQRIAGPSVQGISFQGLDTEVPVRVPARGVVPSQRPALSSLPLASDFRAASGWPSWRAVQASG